MVTSLVVVEDLQTSSKERLERGRKVGWHVGFCGYNFHWLREKWAFDGTGRPTTRLGTVCVFREETGWPETDLKVLSEDETKRYGGTTVVGRLRMSRRF